MGSLMNQVLVQQGAEPAGKGATHQDLVDRVQQGGRHIEEIIADALLDQAGQVLQHGSKLGLVGGLDLGKGIQQGIVEEPVGDVHPQQQVIDQVGPGSLA
jgi:hypothetical protein